jgi:hypothetical protein
MDSEPVERRREHRYPVEAKVVVRKSSGEVITTKAANISGGGMLLQTEPPVAFAIGDEVAVEVEVASEPGMPFASWGLARIVRVVGSCYGLQLSAGTFDSGNPEQAAVPTAEAGTDSHTGGNGPV